MIHEHRQFLKALRLAFDLALVVACYYLLYGAARGLPGAGLVVEHPDYPLRLPLILAVCWSCAFLASGAYDPGREEAPGHPFRLSARILVLMLLVFSAGLFLFKIQFLSRKFFLLYALCCLALLSLSKAAERGLIRLLRRMGFNALSVVLVGEAGGLEGCAKVFGEHAEWGYRVAGAVGISPGTQLPPGLRRLGGLENLGGLLRGHIVDEVVFAASPAGPAFEEVLRQASLAGLPVRVVLDKAVLPWSAQVDRLGSLRGLVLARRGKVAGASMLKGFVDLAGSAALLVLLSPLLGLVAAAVWASMGRPIFFRQKRAGIHGRAIKVYKFRSMVPEARRLQPGLAAANQMNGPVFKIPRDPRVTPLGRFLRRTSLDELPQLINVLRGELSLVGPRPLASYEARKVPAWAWRRYSVKPGMTCLWQVMGRNQVGFEEWMKLDLAYVDRWSMWLDLQILLRTVPAVLSSRGAY